MDFCDYPSLKQLTYRQPQHRLSEQQAKAVIRMIIEAVQYLHTHGICHRDLKPDNILVKDDFSEIKIIDFGVAKRFLIFCNNRKENAKRIELWTRTGTLQYKAPEMFDGIHYNESVDLWAIGIITFEILSGCLPFNSEFMLETIDLIRNAEFKFEPEIFWSSISLEAKDFIKRLLKLKA